MNILRLTFDQCLISKKTAGKKVMLVRKTSFYPKEEVVKFINRFIRKRLGTNEFQDIMNSTSKLRGFDLGCGVGRQTVLLEEFGIEGYGADISATALMEARTLAQHFGFNLENRFIQLTIRHDELVESRDGYRVMRIKIRPEILMCVIENRLPWEDFAIGFQMRVLRSPNEYESDFWCHFTNNFIADKNFRYSSFCGSCTVIEQKPIWVKSTP